MRLRTSATAASTGGRRSVDAFANGSGQNGQGASSRAVSEIDRSTRARSGARSCAGGAAGAGAGAGVSDANTRTQISHRRTFQHRPLVSQAWSTRSTPLRRLRLPGAERPSLKPPHLSFLTPPPCSWNLTTRAGPNWPRAVPSLRSYHGALPGLLSLGEAKLSSTKRQNWHCTSADLLWGPCTHPKTVWVQSQKIQIV